MAYASYPSTPGGPDYYYDRDYRPSASPTPSPRHYAYAEARPATRAHFRNVSGGVNDFSPRQTFSPRYTSTGQYATVNVSATRTSRKESGPGGSRHRKERRNSYSYYRPSDTHGESDEDELIEIDGITYVLPARSKSKRHRHYYYDNVGAYGTDYQYYQTSQPYPARDGYFSPAQEQEYRPSHSRRASASMPQRPATARPASSHHHKKPPAAPKATESDAKKHRIPPGYSLKNWDPTEEPILLLGSVFDANSLGKWIYDWTVYHHGPATPISDMAGELWLLLIQLAGKIKRSEECVPKIRSQENKEMVDDFIESGERLTDKLRKLLKACEAPMLKASKRKDAQLGKNSGVEFVETLFGRERELEKTERFMQSVRLWNLRFDANCEEILKNPTK